MNDQESTVLPAPTSGPADTAIGIVVYNEGRNIRRLLQSIQGQTAAERVSRIIVVASGCTDDTCELVSAMADDDPRIKLLVEIGRHGKIAAINKFIAVAPEPILVVSCGDLILKPATLENLLEPFRDSRTGMVGAHPIPLNAEPNFVGFAVRLMWSLHDRISQREPKMSELYAFRSVIGELDTTALCDEISVEQLVRGQGFEVVYAAEAHVLNQGPRTLSDFISQRIRWLAANLQVMDSHDIRVSTMVPRNVLRAALAHARVAHVRLDWMITLAVIEAYCRLRAWLDYFVFREREKHRVWQPVATTKDLCGASPREVRGAEVLNREK